MKNRKLLAALLLCGSVAFWGCESDSKKEETKTPVEEKPAPAAPAIPVPDFNADSAYVFVEKQVAFGPRVPNTRPHTIAGDWLVQQLKRFGANVQEQKFQMEAFDGKKLNLRNIIASYNPQAANRILLAAHWDTRPFADKDSVNQNKPIDGANDGGSGVGVLLEIARQLGSDQPDPRVGVDIILFDGEDYGQPERSMIAVQKQNTWCLGSQYWSRNKHTPNYRANYGILLDMVGAKGAKFAKEEYSRQYAADVVEKVWRTGNRLGYSDYFIYHNSPGITDDHVYVNAWGGIRMIDIIEYNILGGDDYFGDYHHTHKDNMEIIDRNTLKAVGQTVLQVVYQE